MTLRPYQSHILQAVSDGWKLGYRKQLVVSPTGSGKTIMFAHIAKDEPGRTLILAHRDELINQAIDKIYQATGIRAEKEKAEFHAGKEAKVVVASFQSMIRRLDEWPKDHFSLVVADEAHHSVAPSQLAVLKHFDEHARIVGVTATPDRSDKKDMGVYYDNIACQVPLFTRDGNPIQGLVNQGYLSQIVIRTIPLAIDLSKVGVAHDTESGCVDFKKSDLAAALEPYLDEIATKIKEHAGNRKILGFAPLIDTARKASEACQKAGMRSDYVYGEDPEREAKRQRFADWDYDIMWNAMLWTEGFDDPSIDCVVILRCTKSRSLYAQMAGRGTRIDPPLKENLLLLDFLWQSQKHKLCRPSSLIAQDEVEADVITEMTEKAACLPADVAAECELDLQVLSNSATSQREESLRKKLEENRKKKGKFISAEEFALQHHNIEVAEFEPIVAWHRLPVTEPQAKALKRAKIDPETVRGRGHANALLSIHFAEQKITLASDAQRTKMRQLGCENWESATAHEARQFFGRLRAA